MKKETPLLKKRKEHLESKKTIYRKLKEDESKVISIFDEERNKQSIISLAPSCTEAFFLQVLRLLFLNIFDLYQYPFLYDENDQKVQFNDIITHSEYQIKFQKKNNKKMLDSERDQYLNNIKYKLKFSDFIDVFSPEEILEWRTHASLGLLKGNITDLKQKCNKSYSKINTEYSKLKGYVSELEDFQEKGDDFLSKLVENQNEIEQEAGDVMTAYHNHIKFIEDRQSKLLEANMNFLNSTSDLAEVEKVLFNEDPDDEELQDQIFSEQNHSEDERYLLTCLNNDKITKPIYDPAEFNFENYLTHPENPSAEFKRWYGRNQKRNEIKIEEGPYVVANYQFQEEGFELGNRERWKKDEFDKYLPDKYLPKKGELAFPILNESTSNTNTNTNNLNRTNPQCGVSSSKRTENTSKREKEEQNEKAVLEIAEERKSEREEGELILFKKLSPIHKDSLSISNENIELGLICPMEESMKHDIESPVHDLFIPAQSTLSNSGLTDKFNLSPIQKKQQIPTNPLEFTHGHTNVTQDQNKLETINRIKQIELHKFKQLVFNSMEKESVNVNVNTEEEIGGMEMECENNGKSVSFGEQVLVHHDRSYAKKWILLAQNAILMVAHSSNLANPIKYRLSQAIKLTYARNLAQYHPARKREFCFHILFSSNSLNIECCDYSSFSKVFENIYNGIKYYNKNAILPSKKKVFQNLNFIKESVLKKEIATVLKTPIKDKREIH